MRLSLFILLLNLPVGNPEVDGTPFQSMDGDLPVPVGVSLFDGTPSENRELDGSLSVNRYLAQNWGQIGHYVTGEIAWNYVTSNTAKAIERVLEGQSLAAASVWMDDIRSDSRYNHTHDWHWVTIESGRTYEESEKNPSGDVIHELERLVKELKEKKWNRADEREKLRMVIHLVGDLHQPLHVGNGKDQGGNDIYVRWMGDHSNLHRVWDSQIIESWQMSYRELADALGTPAREEMNRWQQASIRDWAVESISFRESIYDIPENGGLGYEYRFKYGDIVRKRLLQAGVRLAGILNEIYN